MRLDNIKSKITPDEAELVRQAKKQVEYKKVGDHTKRIDGGTVWKVSKADHSVAPAVYRTTDTIHLWDLLLDQVPADKIDIEKGFWYVEAVNQTNALKKLKQNKFILST